MIQKFRSFLRKRGIKSRMFFAFIVLPLVLMVLIFLLYYFISKDIIIAKNEQNSKMFVSLTEENIYLNTKKMEEQMEKITQRDEFLNIYKHPQKQEYKDYFENYIKASLYFEGRRGIQLFDTSFQSIYNEYNKENYAVKNMVEEGEEKTILHWYYDREQEEIVLVSDVYLEEELIGYAICGFSEKAFSPAFSQLDNPSNMLVIVDENDHYLFGNSALRKDVVIDTEENKIQLQGKTYYIEVKAISNIDWKVVNMVDANYLLEEFHNFRNMILVYGIVLLIILEIIAAFVYRSIYDPLHNIIETMHIIDNEYLIGNRVEDDGNDEIHEVATKFNELLDHVEELLKTVEFEQEQKRETQFQLLQAQINPHFLFNTLNTLHFLAIMNEDKPVSEGIGALARLLRNTIVDSKEIVTVNEEIENLKNYIIIQKLRYGDLFETVYNVDDDVRDCHILKFLLQPIVENSILHAFEEDKEHQILTIRIQKEGIYLKIEIGDNGKGFKEIHKEPSNKNLSGIGIENISQRIHLMYGDEYSMKIKSVVNKGTIVTLLLPYVKGDIYV